MLIAHAIEFGCSRSRTDCLVDDRSEQDKIGEKHLKTKRSETMRLLSSRRRQVAWLPLFAVVSATLVTASTIAHAANGSMAYTYDALGRVTTASYDTGVCIIYAYDANGNRTSETIKVSTATATGVWGCFNWNASGGAVWGP